MNIELGSEDAFELALQFLEVLLRLGDGVVVFLDGLVEGALLRLFQASPPEPSPPSPPVPPLEPDPSPSPPLLPSPPGVVPQSLPTWP
ncbi:hypothetical protein [Pseudomonas aeruginosa]|uniref:hypothetical protein n=1 Tax=Pseudomonas aeruginosa TaxID=287 RepID=UPI001EF57A15|nr:hypothetical protein [Pseudomonas aeruginosa]